MSRRVLASPTGPSVQFNGGVVNGGGEDWYENGKLHRLGGPARTRNGGAAAGGSESWWYKGELHREDGPAVIHRPRGVSGFLRNGWYLHGIRFQSLEDYRDAVSYLQNKRDKM